MRGIWNYWKGEGKEKGGIYEGNADEQGMGGGGKGKTGVPRMAESAFW